MCRATSSVAPPGSAGRNSAKRCRKKSTFGPAEEALIADITERVRRYEAQMDAIEVRKSAAELRAIWAAGNEYLQAEAPWTTFKTDPDKAAAQVASGAEPHPASRGFRRPSFPLRRPARRRR